MLHPGVLVGGARPGRATWGLSGILNCSAAPSPPSPGTPGTGEPWQRTLILFFLCFLKRNVFHFFNGS